MHFSLVKICPPDEAAHGFDDAILPMYHALRHLGFTVEILLNRGNPDSRNIVFGSCHAPRKTGRSLPRGSIVVNLEQLNEGSLWLNSNYLAHLREFEVWDYSPRNIRTLEGKGIGGVALLPPGYVPQMTRINPGVPKDVDVLFYGLLNERRLECVNALCTGGVRVLASQAAFGNLRDALLARSRLLLNLHYYLPARLEMVRLGYAFANRKAVLSERREDTEIPAGLEDACAFVPYEEIVSGAQRLLADPALRKRQEERAFAAFTAMPLAGHLEKLLGRRTFSVGTPSTDRAPTMLSPGEPVQEWLITGDLR